MPHELPKAYEPGAIETRWAEYWVNEKLFHVETPAPGETRPVFTLLLPPPNVTGRLHMGHMLNQTQMDILVRWHRMRGFITLWLPGTDHAGIATQMMVERQLAKEGKKRRDLGREKFIERVWEWKKLYGGAILDQMKRLGASVDWDREYFTMDENLSHAVREVFVRLYEEGLIYRGKYIVNWCPRCETAISDLEVKHEEVAGKLWEIRYPVVGSDEFIVVATTRPETMLGDTAVAVNAADERYTHLHGKSVLLPLMKREIPIILDEIAKPEFGTGALQVTPTGQVASSYPGSETVFSLNLKRAAQKIPQFVAPQTLLQVQTDVRMVTKTEAVAGDPAPKNTQSPELVNPPEGNAHVRHRFTLATDPGIEIQAEFYRPADGKHKALLVLRNSLDPALEPGRAEEVRRFRAMADAGTAVMVIAPRPSPPGGEETKSPILGPFYMTELRASLVGKTLLGMRADDVIRAFTFLSGGETEDPNNISAEASGHMGLALLHAAVLDPRIKHVTVDHVLESYRSLLEAPMPLDAPQDILPGVLLKYDIPDLVRVLGPRVTFTSPLPGTANLAVTGKP